MAGHELDETNRKILNLLQQDCRASLTTIAKHVGLSVDSVKKRVDKLSQSNVFFPKIQLRPRHFGYPYVVDVRVKLHTYTDTERKAFVEALMAHPRVAELIAVSGAWDFTIVIIAKDHEDLNATTAAIREQYGSIISEWIESLTTVVYKFETYDMLALGEEASRGK